MERAKHNDSEPDIIRSAYQAKRVISMKIILSADDFGRSHEMNLAINYAMRNEIVYSTSLLMGSQFTEEAAEMALEGEYVHNVHCHLNLAACTNVGNHFVPLNDEYKKSRFCKDGEFLNAWYGKVDFYRYIDVIYKELETQYLAFKALTKDKANYLHIDFHRYLNLSLPVAFAYDRLIRNYHIQSARFYGEHQSKVREPKKKRLLHAAMMFHWKHSKAFVAKSSKVRWFLENIDQFKNEQIIELFVHPDYRDGVLVDTTPSLSGGEICSLEERIDLVKQSGTYDYISWASLNH